LNPFFYERLTAIDDVLFRQGVFRDLQRDGPRYCVDAFARAMARVRSAVERAPSLQHPCQQEMVFLSAVIAYCEGVISFSTGLQSVPLESFGLIQFREYLNAYVESPEFRALDEEAQAVRNCLAHVQYCLTIDGARVTVTPFASEPDYAGALRAAFDRFRQESPRGHLARLPEHPELSRVEAQILDIVTRLFEQDFERLHRFFANHQAFLDDGVAAFDREAQVYMGYLEYMERLQRSGLKFCYPTLVDARDPVFAKDTFDLVLAATPAAGASRPLGAEGGRQRREIVCNDFSLKGKERILVVTGPNQGGKTTFARTMGQLYHLAALGFPVPGSAVQVSICDEIYTHFARSEDIARERGKLEDDIVRMREILARATSCSVVIVNEIFTSTTRRDALVLGTGLVRALVEMGAVGAYVTFVEELSSLGDAVVSMVSTVPRDDPSGRTFRVVRLQPRGTAHAMAIADKYGLSYAQVRERLAP